jgi:hypothetical protein
MDPGNPFGPARNRARGPLTFPEPVSSVSSSSLWRVGPTRQHDFFFFYLRPLISPETRPSPPLLPRSIPFNACPFRRPSHAYK